MSLTCRMSRLLRTIIPDTPHHTGRTPRQRKRGAKWRVARKSALSPKCVHRNVSPKCEMPPKCECGSGTATTIPVTPECPPGHIRGPFLRGAAWTPALRFATAGVTARVSARTARRRCSSAPPKVRSSAAPSSSRSTCRGRCAGCRRRRGPTGAGPRMASSRPGRRCVR